MYRIIIAKNVKYVNDVEHQRLKKEYFYDALLKHEAFQKYYNKAKEKSV